MKGGGKSSGGRGGIKKIEEKQEVQKTRDSVDNAREQMDKEGLVSSKGEGEGVQVEK